MTFNQVRRNMYALYVSHDLYYLGMRLARSQVYILVRKICYNLIQAVSGILGFPLFFTNLSCHVKIMCLSSQFCGCNYMLCNQGHIVISVISSIHQCYIYTTLLMISYFKCFFTNSAHKVIITVFFMKIRHFFQIPLFKKTRI